VSWPTAGKAVTTLECQPRALTQFFCRMAQHSLQELGHEYGRTEQDQSHDEKHEIAGRKIETRTCPIAGNHSSDQNCPSQRPSRTSMMILPALQGGLSTEWVAGRNRQFS